MCQKSGLRDKTHLLRMFPGSGGGAQSPGGMMALGAPKALENLIQHLDPILSSNHILSEYSGLERGFDHIIPRT